MTNYEFVFPADAPISNATFNFCSRVKLFCFSAVRWIDRLSVVLGNWSLPAFPVNFQLGLEMVRAGQEAAIAFSHTRRTVLV